MTTSRSRKKSKEPKVRPDGSCVTCGKLRPVVKPQKGVSKAAYVDPFCSRLCCEEWFGLEEVKV